MKRLAPRGVKDRDAAERKRSVVGPHLPGTLHTKTGEIAGWIGAA
jgi:hypothetical protein